jgi:hypothetical protein
MPKNVWQTFISGMKFVVLLNQKLELVIIKTAEEEVSTLKYKDVILWGGANDFSRVSILKKILRTYLIS